MSKSRYPLFLIFLVTGGVLPGGEHSRSMAQTTAEPPKTCLQPKSAAKVLIATTRSALHGTRRAQSQIMRSGF